MSPTEHDIAAYCQEKFRQYDEHLRTGDTFRDKVNFIEGSIGYIIKTVDAFKGADLTIKCSLIGIVFAIVLQIGGFIYLWGRMTQTVEGIDKRLNVMEDMHPRVSADYKRVVEDRN